MMNKVSNIIGKCEWVEKIGTQPKHTPGSQDLLCYCHSLGDDG